MRAKEAREAKDGEDLIDQLKALVAKAQAILDKAEDQRIVLLPVHTSP